MQRREDLYLKRTTTAAILALSIAPFADLTALGVDPEIASRPISELAPVATIHVGKSADWVAILADAVWVGSTGPFAVHRIDPRTDRLVATVELPGEPCAGLASGFGSLWIPLCGHSPALAKVDLSSNSLVSVIKLAAVEAEGGVTTGADSVWVLTAGGKAVWTLNQGDGSLTRIDTQTHSTKTIGLGTPGHGGDISFGGGMIWTTVAKVPLSAVDSAAVALRCRWTGPGGDSLGIGHDAIWLTDYHAGTISRIKLDDALARCKE